MTVKLTEEKISQEFILVYIFLLTSIMLVTISVSTTYNEILEIFFKVLWASCEVKIDWD